MTNHEYNWQMNRSNARWTCPICSEIAEWDDETLDEAESQIEEAAR